MDSAASARRPSVLRAMTNAETAHANAPDAVPRLPDADASGGGDDAASAAKTGGSRAASRGSASPFSREELAALDAVRDEAKRRYTRALAPKLGEKTYGHSEREAEAEAEAEAEREAAREAAKATMGRSNDERSSHLDAADATAVPNDEALPYEPEPPTAVSAVSARGSGTHAPPRTEATAKVGVATLMAEVKARAREYVARREAELVRAARARAEAAERAARERRAERAEEQKKQARGLGKVQFETDAEVDFAAEAEREAAARQAAERQLNNELLEARLRAWPMSRVLSAVEEAIRATLAERRRAAGLDQEDELFGAGSARVPVADPSATETDGDGTNGPLNEPGLAAGETRALSGDARLTTRRAEGPGVKKPRGNRRESISEDVSEDVSGDLFSSSFRKLSETKKRTEKAASRDVVVLSPEDAATSRAYDAACVAFSVAPNEKARDGLLSASGVCDVSGACLGDDAARAAARGVARAPKVTHLSMRACDIGPDGFRGIFAELPGDPEPSLESASPSSPSLTALDFSTNPRGLGTVGSRAFCEWLSRSSKNALAVLHLRGCDVRDSEGAAVIAALGANAASLTRLNLSQNALGSKSAAALARFLETFPGRCADVDVSANWFGPSDAETIASALQSPRCSVKNLSLARNGLEDAGCVAVADATARNASLVALDLRRVRFGPAAARATAAALAKNTTLESLYLDGNDIGADECASLLRALDASRLSRRGGEHNVSTEPGSSLKSVSLVGARTQDAASAARALGERRFLAEGGGKKPKKGKKGGAKGKKGGAKKGGKKGEKAVPVLQSELAQAAPGTFRAFETTRPEGRHVFDLVDPAQRGVAGSIFEADHGHLKEVGGSAEDTNIRSSHTGRQNIVNLTLDGLAVKEDPVAMGWPDALPKRGVLRFDFAALGVDGLASACVLLDDAAFANTSRDVGSRRLTPRERLEALEHARRDRAFTCAQVAALLETFDVGESRVDAAAALLPRLAPLPPRDGRGGLGLAAEAQAIALAPLTAFEQTAVFARFGVGHARYLPFRRGAPSGRYELDMALRCDRAVAASLAAEAAKDADFENFRRVEVDGSSGSGDLNNVAAWTRGHPGHLGIPIPIPTSGVLKFEYVKKPESFTDAAGAWTDGARRLRGVEAKAIAARLRRRDAGPRSFGYVAGSEADAVVAFRRAMCGDSTRVRSMTRTMTCAFAGAIVAAARDSETRVELAVASRDFCVDVGENWLQVVESLRGDEQAAACARVEAWPEADVAAGVAAFERSERKAERTARRREARLEREREAAEAKAAAEAEKAAEKAAREAAKAAEKAAREAAKGGKKKKEATATNAEASEDAADADDGDAEATAVQDPDEEREDGVENGDGEGDDEKKAAADEAAAETNSAADAAEETTIADAAEEESADGFDETPSADAPKKSKRTSSKEASSSSAADDEIDEEDGQPLEIGEPVMAPASMRYVLDCANATHAAVFEKIIAAAVAAPSKWRSIRNFRVGGAARDDLVENLSGETLETLFARAEAAAKEAAVVRDASAVDDVTRAACAAKRRESDIAFYERKRAEAAKARVEAKSSRKSRAATRDDDDDDDFFGFPTLDPPSRAHEEKLSGAPFIVQLDFFGLDVFERFRVPFMEKRFYREAFLDVRAKALEADGVRHAHAFHLREMAAEARDDAEKAEKARAEAEARAVRVERDKEEAEEAEDAEEADEADADDAEDREDVRDGEDKDVVKDVGDDSAKLDSAKRATETEASVSDEASNLSKPQTSAFGNARAAAEEDEADSVPPEVAFPTVLVAGPAFAPASSPWFAPPTGTSSGEISARECVTSFARASLADPSPVYRKTWERFGAAQARLERDASYYSAARVVRHSDETVTEESVQTPSVQTPTRMRRFHACPLREIWRDVRLETWRLNVSELESVSAKLRKIVDAAAPAAALARAAEEALENANADPRLVEAREADPIDQNLVKTLETELAETLVPLRANLDTAREKAERAAEAAAAAAAEAARKDEELRLLRSRGAFGGDDATAPAKRANDVLKKRTGGVGFSETLIEQCCALTDACVEDLRAYEAELKAFNENPPAPPEPPKPGDDAGGSPPPAPQPPKRPADARSITWRAFETMFMSTDFAELQRGAAENDAKGNKAKTLNPPRREDAIAAAVRLERAEARAKAAARAEAAAARARAAAEAAAAAREAAGEEPIDPMDAVGDPRESASADPAASLASEDEDGDAEGAPDARDRDPRPPLAVVGLPRITPAALAAFEASRAAAEKAALAAAAAAEAKAAKAAKGKKPPAKKPGKAADAKDAEDAISGSIAVEKSSRFAAGLFSGDDLVKAAAGVDPNPFVYVPPPEEEDAKK